MPLPNTPALTVDAAVFDAESRLLLVRRKRPPFQGQYALPGGFVDIGEPVEAACRRELLEETNVKVGQLQLVGVYSDPARDPRGHTCSVAFLAHVEQTEPKAGDDAEEAAWFADWSNLEIAFDHRQIIADAIAADKALEKNDCASFAR